MARNPDRRTLRRTIVGDPTCYRHHISYKPGTVCAKCQEAARTPKRTAKCGCQVNNAAGICPNPLH